MRRLVKYIKIDALCIRSQLSHLEYFFRYLYLAQAIRRGFIKILLTKNRKKNKALFKRREKRRRVVL
jgi:hypothetical protein